MSEQNTNRIKLTKRVVESVSPDSSKQKFLWDTEITGFGVRIYPTGRKMYFFQYRNQHKTTKKIKIGVHGNITTEQAREAAKELAIKASMGKDPAAESKSQKSSPTMTDLARDYMKLHALEEKNSKSIINDRCMLKNHILKEFDSKKVREVTTRDIQVLRVKLSDKRVASNRVLSLLHKMFNLAIQWEWCTDNPVSGVKKYKENKRTRWLQDDELKKLMDVLDSYHNQTMSNIIRLLLLTGARKNEALQATWDQIDLEKGVWTKSAHTTKQKKMQHIPLSPTAVKLLKKMKAEKTDSPYLFPGRVKGQHLKEPKKAWATIRKRAELEDFTIHDLRHTYASHLVSSGLSLTIVGKLLGHTQASTTQRYAHLADESLREATNLFAEKFEKLGNMKN
ncbi:MAG: site-specific integrase [Pseudomonadota bacterium]